MREPEQLVQGYKGDCVVKSEEEVLTSAMVVAAGFAAFVGGVISVLFNFFVQ